MLCRFLAFGIAVIAGQRTARGQAIDTPVIPKDKDNFSAIFRFPGEGNSVTMRVTRKAGAAEVLVQFGTQPAIKAPRRDTSEAQGQIASIPDGQHCDNQGMQIVGPYPFLCEVFYVLIPTGSDPSEMAYEQRDPYAVALTKDFSLRFWTPFFLYLVSARNAMNGDFSQVVTKWVEEVHDGSNNLKERWEPKKTIGESLPRFDGDPVYGVQWRLQNGLGAKVSAMMMFDMPYQPEITESGRGTANRLFPSGADLKTGDVVTLKNEFSTYSRIDCDNDDIVDKVIYRIDFGSELTMKVGDKASKADLTITEKKRDDAIIATRIKITKFPAPGKSDGLKPAEDAATNDPKNRGWRGPVEGAVEKTAP